MSTGNHRCTHSPSCTCFFDYNKHTMVTGKYTPKDHNAIISSEATHIRPYNTAGIVEGKTFLYRCGNSKCRQAIKVTFAYRGPAAINADCQNCGKTNILEMPPSGDVFPSVCLGEVVDGEVVE